MGAIESCFEVGQNFWNSPQRRQFCTSCEARHRLQCWSWSDFGTSPQSKEGRICLIKLMSPNLHQLLATNTLKKLNFHKKLGFMCLGSLIRRRSLLSLRPSPPSWWNLWDMGLGLLAGWRSSSSELDVGLVVPGHLRHPIPHPDLLFRGKISHQMAWSHF